MVSKSKQKLKNRRSSIMEIVALAAPRIQPKSILKSSDPKKKFTRSDLQLRFKDQCKTSYPYLAFFSKDSS